MTTVQTVWYYKAAVFECAIDAAIAGALVWLAATSDKSWADLSPTARASVYVLAIIQVLKTWRSFASTTMADLKAGKAIANTQQEVTDYNAAKIAAVKRGSL